MGRVREKALSERGVYEIPLTEEMVIGQIRQLLELNGARVHRIVERIPWGKRTSTPGIPDIAGWFPRGARVRCLNVFPLSDNPGRIITIPAICSFWIEVKRPGGKHRPAQTAWIEAARQDGVIAFFADSVEAMVAGFKEFGIEIKGL